MSSVLLTFLFLLISVMPMTVLAETYQDSSPNELITESFNTEIEAGSDNCFHVTEEITVDFVTPHHGIFRYIPTSDNYEIENLQVRSGQSFETDYEDGNKIVKIGSASTYLDGQNTYVISYDLDFYKDSSTESDLLNIDLLPTGWDTSIRESSIHLSMPYDVDWQTVNLYCGKYGTQDSADRMQVLEAEGRELRIHASDLPQGYGITAYSELSEGYWVNATSYYERHRTLGLVMLALTALAILLAAVFWFLFGRDKYKMFRPVMVRPPRGMTPLEIGYYYHDAVEDRDVMSMLFYFANKGWLKIRQIPSGGGSRLNRSKDQFELVKVRDADESEKPYVQKMAKRMFSLFGSKSALSLNQFNEKLQKSSTNNFITHARTEVPKGVSIKNEGKNTGLRALVFLVSAAAIILSGFVSGPEYWIFTIPIAAVWGLSAIFMMKCVDRKKKSSFFIGLLLGLFAEFCMIFIAESLPVVSSALLLIMMPAAILFLALMQSPSREYQMLMGEIYGFKNYIQKVDEQRLRVQLEESPDYFYDILPYAIVFGLESRWSKQFTDLGLAPSDPSWYDSSAPFVYSSMWTNNLVRSMGESIHINSDSGGSGGGGGGFSSGGGFSGGGGGGGGGGGW